MSWLPILLAACVDWTPADLDGDGVLASQGDCDDLDGDVHPRAQETWYDGTDQNCDGNDADRDQDTYLAVEAEGDDCWDDPSQIPAEFAIVTGQGFLQPSAIQVNPGADDTWYDGVDQDCDGADDFDQDLDGLQSGDHPQKDGTTGEDCDDTDPLITDTATWYADTDGDGYGDPEVSVQDCDAPTDFVSNDQDCDDSDASLSPETPWYEDADEDGYGDPNSIFY